jgi:hypothetical protein
MKPDDGADPMRSTLIAILQQLNRAESIHEGRAADQSLELAELQRMLRRFWAVDGEDVKLPQALGLLVHNGLVAAQVERSSARPSHGSAAARARYRITPEGKQFLVETLQKTNRIA